MGDYFRHSAPGGERSSYSMNPIEADLTESQQAELRSSSLFNDDLAPGPAGRRKWRLGSFAALWISMSACIPTYMLASSLIGGGMNWWEAVLTIFLGNLIVVRSEEHTSELQSHSFI